MSHSLGNPVERPITYRRGSRRRRLRGVVVESDPVTGMVKVKPAHPEWRMVWLSPDEVAAGQHGAPKNPRTLPAVVTGMELVGMARAIAAAPGDMLVLEIVDLIGQLATELETAIATP